MKKKFQGEVAEHRQKYKTSVEQQEHFDEKLKESLQQLLKSERIKPSESIKTEILNEQQEQMTLMQNELAKKSEQVKELNRAKAQIVQLKRENSEIEIILLRCMGQYVGLLVRLLGISQHWNCPTEIL